MQARMSGGILTQAAKQPYGACCLIGHVFKGVQWNVFIILIVIIIIITITIIIIVVMTLFFVDFYTTISNII